MYFPGQHLQSCWGILCSVTSLAFTLPSRSPLAFSPLLYAVHIWSSQRTSVTFAKVCPKSMALSYRWRYIAQRSVRITFSSGNFPSFKIYCRYFQVCFTYSVLYLFIRVFRQYFHYSRSDEIPLHVLHVATVQC